MPHSLPQKSKVSRDVTGAMQQRPALALLIAQIATNWTRIEELLGRSLTQLLGAEAKSGMIMYQALSGSASRTAVLKAVAKYRSPTIATELENVLTPVRRAAGKRNDIIHGHWFYSDDHPDDLVWLASKDDLVSYSEFWAGYNADPDHQKQIDFAKRLPSQASELLALQRGRIQSHTIGNPTARRSPCRLQHRLRKAQPPARRGIWLMCAKAGREARR